VAVRMHQRQRPRTIQPRLQSPLRQTPAVLGLIASSYVAASVYPENQRQSGSRQQSLRQGHRWQTLLG
jgi:hypothetical protein